jgi:hypothetical protein
VKPDKEEERKMAGILDRLRSFGIETMVESNARYALRMKNGDADEAFRLLLLLQETYEGIVKPYNPDMQLLGAQNREGVTCYLDALLFAMFARLDSFEAMLYDNFNDPPRKRMAGLLRLWVNLLRTGRLITTDVTRHMQEALAGCGWEDAARLRQQDPSEAFGLITGQLELPLLTLKMDLFHTGREEPQDDHKFVNERLLEVAIPDQPSEGNSVTTLEDCLEHYFNNRIEVKRHLEERRRNTLSKSADLDFLESPTDMEKPSSLHVEVAEMSASAAVTPLIQTPASASQGKDPLERVRPGIDRKRGNSIFSQRKVELTLGIDPEKDGGEGEGREQERKMSTRTEILLPAWQFFKLLPWYTDHMPTSDAQVAAHFAKKRPVLGICLKRYSFTNTGQAIKRDAYIDIPLEIAVPNFVSDDQMNEDGPLAGNFRLILQSVVCHRGLSTHSGHYVALCRGQASNAVPESQPTSRRGSMTDSDEGDDPWMRFDDLANPRVTYVDIREALKHETPYLLFYQVQPIGDDGHSIHDLPTYAEATSRSTSEAAKLEEKPYHHPNLGSENALEQIPSQVISEGARPGSDTTGRTSLDALGLLDGARGRSSSQIDDQRVSLTVDEQSFAGSVSGGSINTDANHSVPTTPAEELPMEKSSFLAVANKLSGSRRGNRWSKGSTSKPRPTSAGPELSYGRNSNNSARMTLNKLTSKMSKMDLTPRSDELLSPTAPDSGAATDVEPASELDVAIPPEYSENDTKPRDSLVESPEKFAALTKKEKAAVKAAAKKRAKQDQDVRECNIM